MANAYAPVAPDFLITNVSYYSLLKAIQYLYTAHRIYYGYIIMFLLSILYYRFHHDLILQLYIFYQLNKIIIHYHLPPVNLPYFVKIIYPILPFVQIDPIIIKQMSYIMESMNESMAHPKLPIIIQANFQIRSQMQVIHYSVLDATIDQPINYDHLRHLNQIFLYNIIPIKQTMSLNMSIQNNLFTQPPKFSTNN